MDLDKAQIARRQLGTALALFLDDHDPVSVHTLACSGAEVAGALAAKAGAKPFSGHALATFADLDITEVRRLQNQFWNAFKHASTHKGFDRDDAELIGRFTDVQNDHALFVGWYDYAKAVRVLPIESRAFLTWYFALYPDKVSGEADVSKYQRQFREDLRSCSRVEQKKSLRERIEVARDEDRIMNDPLTEKESLVLPP
jgi:hypothetical protein